MFASTNFMEECEMVMRTPRQQTNMIEDKIQKNKVLSTLRKAIEILQRSNEGLEGQNLILLLKQVQHEYQNDTTTSSYVLSDIKTAIERSNLEPDVKNLFCANIDILTNKELVNNSNIKEIINTQHELPKERMQHITDLLSYFTKNVENVSQDNMNALLTILNGSLNRRLTDDDIISIENIVKEVFQRKMETIAKTCESNNRTQSSCLNDIQKEFVEIQHHFGLIDLHLQNVQKTGDRIDELNQQKNLQETSIRVMIIAAVLYFFVLLNSKIRTKKQN